MSDHADRAKELLAEALESDDAPAWAPLAAAGIHSVLAVADAIKHGLRDIIYELRD